MTDGWSSEAIALEPSRLWTHRGSGFDMPHAHAHDDIELNLVLRGRLVYLFGGARLTVRAGELAVFWGTTPHRLIETDADEPGEMCWLHVPLATAIGWGLPGQELARLLRGAPAVVAADAVRRDLDSAFDAWASDLTGVAGDHRDDEAEAIAMLEVQAVIRRALREPGADASGTPAVDHERMRPVAVMARVAATRFREPITAIDVATASGLNPRYAMTLFRSVVGTTIGAYLTQVRVAEAQRLLISSGRSTSDIAHAAGFGSQSAFYESFTRACGRPPGAYRRGLRSAAN